MKKLKNNYLKYIIIILGLIALGALFLPYEKSIGDYREQLETNSENIYLEEVGFYNKDVVDISIIENFEVYQYTLKNASDNDWLYGEALVNVIVTIALIIAIVLVILFAICGKNILTIIFNIILAISSLVMNYDIVSRGVLPTEKYTYGISYYIYIILAIIILICCIVSIIHKKNKKKIQNN